VVFQFVDIPYVFLFSTEIGIMGKIQVINQKMERRGHGMVYAWICEIARSTA
jgi:hypothetical protein